MNWTSVAITAAVTVTAAAAGNLLIPTAAVNWFRTLNWPRWLVPYPVFIAVGIAYYVLMGTVLYRALDRHDTAAIAWSIVLIIANEAWNAVFFGRRSTLGGFAGILAFTVPVTALLLSAREDGLSLVLVILYAAWVAYDIAWTFALWRGNRGRGDQLGAPRRAGRPGAGDHQSSVRCTPPSRP
jgi:tryptophan-rich sensory protein